METQDRELLELAAKAAGMTIVARREDGALGLDEICSWWNPLADDGDALRLAVKLRISIAEYGNCYARAYSPIIGGVGRFHQAENDLQEAVRYAIVKVAADIVKGMQ